MSVFLGAFLGLAVIGLALSLAVHAAALLALPPPLGPGTWLLHLGAMVVWLAALVAAYLRAGLGSRGTDWWAILRGCPGWMRWLTYGALWYAVVNLFLTAAVAPAGVAAGGAANAPSEVYRAFSGHWIAFYAAAASTLYAAWFGSGTVRLCANGHPGVPGAILCDVCGDDLAK